MLIYDDGRYKVSIHEEQSGRWAGRWRVDTWFVGHYRKKKEADGGGDRSEGRKSTSAPSKDDALRIARRYWDDYIAGHIVAPNPPPKTMSELVEIFCSRTKGKGGRVLSEATGRAYRTQLVGLLEATGDHLPPHQLQRRHVERAVSRSGSARSQAQWLRAIRAFVRWGIKRRWLTVDVTEDVEVDSGPRDVGAYLLPSEIVAWEAAASPSMRIRGGLIIETGWRADEAVCARPEWLRRGLGRPSFRVPGHDPVSGFTAKGRSQRPIPASAKAQRLFDEARERWPKGPYLLHEQPEPCRSDNWTRDVHRACRLAGVDEHGQPLVTDVSLHGLRRTAGVKWLQAGLDIYTVSRLLGHSSVTVTEAAYADIVQGDLADAFDAVDAVAQLPQLKRRRG